MSTPEAAANGHAPARRTRDPDRGAKILAAARTLFYERGFHAVSVDEIGVAAGASGAAIYRHFSGKEEILSTLFDDALDQYFVSIPDRGDDPLRALETLVRNHLEFTIAHRELGSLWAHEHRALSGSYQRRLDRRTRLYVSQWVDVLERAYPDVPRKSLRSAALVTIGTTSSLVSRPGRAISARESAIVLQMLMAGLLAVCQD